MIPSNDQTSSTPEAPVLIKFDFVLQKNMIRPDEKSINLFPFISLVVEATHSDGCAIKVFSSKLAVEVTKKYFNIVDSQRS